MKKFWSSSKLFWSNYRDSSRRLRNAALNFSATTAGFLTKLVFNKKFGEELTLNPSFRDGALAPRISSEGTLAYLFRNSLIFVISVFHVEALAYLGTKKLRRMKIFFFVFANYEIFLNHFNASFILKKYISLTSFI